MSGFELVLLVVMGIAVAARIVLGPYRPAPRRTQGGDPPLFAVTSALDLARNGTETTVDDFREHDRSDVLTELGYRDGEAGD